MNEKVRPRSFDKVIGQNNMKHLITKSIEQNIYPQFSMFTGPTGVGKSTMAHIVGNTLAGESGVVRVVNMAEHMSAKDTSEMVKEIFQLKPGRDNLIYILEEVQILTEQQQTPFLEEISKQPKGVYVIMCTTDERRLLPALRGRSTNYELMKPNSDECGKLVRSTCEFMKVKAPTDADIHWLVRKSRNTPREIVKYLQMLQPLGDLSSNTIQTYLGSTGSDTLLQLFSIAKDGDMFTYSRFLESSAKSHDKLYEEVKEFMQDLYYQIYGYDKSLFSAKQKKLIKDIFKDFSEEQMLQLLTEVGGTKVDNSSDAFFKLLEFRQLLRREHKTQKTVIQESARLAKVATIESERKDSGYESASASESILTSTDLNAKDDPKYNVEADATVENVQKMLGDIELYE